MVVAALSVAAASMAAVLVAALPTRLLAPVVTVLAAFGLLVFFYVALAGLTRWSLAPRPSNSKRPQRLRN